MNLTLKQYIQVYQGARMVKSLKTEQSQSLSTQNDTEKIFSQKIYSLKQIIKNYLQDDKILKYIQYELQQLKKVFNKMFRMNVFKLNKTSQLQHSKMNSRKNRLKSKLQIPQLPIYDESLDEIRTTNMMASPKLAQKMDVSTPLIKHAAKELQSTIKKFKHADNVDIKISNKSAASIYSDASSTLKKIPSREYITKITPAKPLDQIPTNQKVTQKCFLPPKLSKKCSEDDDQIRFSKKTGKSYIQSRVFYAK